MGVDDPKSILVVIVDTNPVWWGQRILKHERELLLSECLDAVMVFCNSFLMLSHHNQLAVIAAHSNNSKIIYPKRKVPDEEPLLGAAEFTPRGEKDGKYELFANVNHAIFEEIQDMVLNEPQGALYSDSLIAGALSLALCYINRLVKEDITGESASSRILVIKGSEDNSSQYLNFMNVVFTAQKQNIAIDSCILANDSGLLQQACDITGGMYLKIPQVTGLLQYLLWVFLPDPATRSSLTLPPQVQVDYRAACFCHRNLIDVGYVCSVCLSIFCTFSPICSTCQTTFKFKGPPRMLKKKSKKS